MDRWLHVQLRHGQVPLDPDELPLAVESFVRLYDGDDRTPYENGTLTLTPKRLFWVDGEGSARAIEMPLASVKSISKTDGHNLLFHKSSSKIVVHLHPVSDRGSHPMEQWVRISPKFSVCRISFRAGHGQMALFQTAMGKALADQGWKPPEASSIGAVGIAAIVQNKKVELDRSEASIKEAFQGDLAALMANAKDMVKLAEKFAKKGNRGSDKKEEAEFQSYILGLGIADPVTKSAAGKSGSDFHKDLAQELASFLPGPLAQGKGMMLLQDVYCIYNRARGTELISPDDLVNAAEMFDQLGVPMALRTFASGVCVIQAQEYSDDKIAAKVLALAKLHASITVTALAQTEEVSTTLAREYLLTTERCGLICRDDTVESLSFFPNRFLGHA